MYSNDDIIDHVGAENWEMVKNEWIGKTLEEILSDLDNMYPFDDNIELANAIYNSLN